MSEEWGPWIEHDGKGCPCVGEYVRVAFDDGRQEIEGIARDTDPDGMSGWYWRNNGRVAVFIRYRIRKPRGMVILQSILETLPESVDA